MGYTTDFSGGFAINKPLTPKMKKYLEMFNETRRMGRKVDEAFGIEGEFYVFGSGSMGQGNDKDIISHSTPPTTQPGLWCQWRPNEDGTQIVWDEGEKFYCYTEWLVYLIHKILAPNGYVLNGQVTWSGEETGDVGELIVEDNKVFTIPYKGKKEEMTVKTASKYDYKNGEMFDFMRSDVVLNIDILIEENQVKLIG